MPEGRGGKDAVLSLARTHILHRNVENCQKADGTSYNTSEKEKGAKDNSQVPIPTESGLNLTELENTANDTGGRQGDTKGGHSGALWVSHKRGDSARRGTVAVGARVPGARLLMRDLGDIGVNVAADSKGMKTEEGGKPDERQHLDGIRGPRGKSISFLSRPR